MLNFPTCHCHVQSLDSASTPEAFADRELELGTGVITVTDHGSLAACRKVYDLAKKKGLTPILGIEAYFRDDDCPILEAAGYPKNAKGAFTTAPKYHHITIHFLDQAAYECGVRLLSRADARLESTLARLEARDRKHGGERKPLFTWADLEELGAYNVTMTSGCMVGMVQRHVKDHQDLKVAEKYYQRLRSIVKPGHFYVELLPHDCSMNWVDAVFITVAQVDGKERVLQWYDGKTLRTNAGELKAGELARAWRAKGSKHSQFLGVKNYSTWEDEPTPLEILRVEHRQEFVRNECTPWAPDGDIQVGLNKVVRALAKRYGDKILIGDDSHYVRPEEKIVQDVRLSQQPGNWRFYGSYHRLSSEEAYAYFRTRMGVTENEFQGWVENAQGWSEQFKHFKWDVQLDLPTKFYEPKYLEYAWSRNPSIPARDHSLLYAKELIEKHGRMDWADRERVARLKAEFKLLHNNDTIDLVPYFFIDEEVCSVYERAGLLTGPGRGSAAGLLLTYLLGITHVDPLRYGLSMERFLTEDRIRSGKWPDIDQDLPGRELLTDPQTGWLRQRFGDHYAQISVDTTLKLRMAVQDVARYSSPDGILPDAVVALTKRFLMPPQGVNDIDFVLGYDSDEGHQQGSIEYDQALQEYVRRYPDQWEIVKKCLGLARQKGRHACAYVIANRPIHEFIPLTTISDVRVTAYTAPSVEAVGGLKMDFLVINSLNDLGDAIQLEQRRHAHTVDISQYKLIQHDEPLVGWSGPRFTENRFSLVVDGKRVPCQRLVPVNGRFYDIWDLAADQAVFTDIANGKTETVFQFNTAGAVQWLEHFAYTKPDGAYAIDSIEAMAAFTALDRPGPLDMFVGSPDDPTNKRRHNLLVEYARRARAAEPSSDVLKIFDELIPETYGVMVYQEQLQKVYQALTGCSGAEAEEFRSDVAKKKKSKVEKAYKPFIEKAGAKIGKENAEAAWQFFITWAKYGFNKSHAVCYSVIGYACAYLKHHFELEWWCAVLRNAAKNEVNEKFWRHCGHLIDMPDVQHSGPSFEIQEDRIRAPLSIIHGVGAAAHEQLLRYAPYADIDDFCKKIELHRQQNKYPVKKVVDADARNRWVKCRPEEAEEVRKGHSALNRKVVYTLIISGAMDSLFPQGEGRNVYDNLADYERALAHSSFVPTARKTSPKVGPVDPKYVNLGVLPRYQRRKAILPVYSEDLVQLLVDTKSHFVTTMDHRPAARRAQGGEPVSFATCNGVEQIERQEMEENERTTVAVAAYVEESRCFAYGTEGDRREACEVVLDVEGGRFKFVKWGGRNRLPDIFRQPLKGAVAIAILTKFASDRPFAIDELTVVQPPLDLEDDASDGEDQ
jgi:DNA polymerase III alpha subunit